MRRLQHLFGGLKVTRPSADTHTPQQGDIEGAVDPTVKVSAGRGDATLPLEYSKVVGCYAELSGGFRYVYAVHLRDSKP